VSQWILDGQNLKVSALTSIAFRRSSVQPEIEIPGNCRARIEKSHRSLLKLLEARVPIYGVTTGFGDSGNRTISAHQSEQLQ
jgi:histidine ammonia-lyase/phenylalanine ammonia-lyase